MTSFPVKRPLALDLTAAQFAALPRGRHAIAYRDLFSPHADLPTATRRWAEEQGFDLRALTLRSRERGARSQKVLFALRDGVAVESVLIRRHDGYTACISSQVGCAFACRFCASGQAGLKRNLSAGEIVEQVVRLGPRVNRIVFMGIGEPLNNYENVLKAIRILRDRQGMDFPSSGITLSTIGIPKGLKALREEHLAINLTISLHATTDESRAALIPGSRKHGVAEVVARALSWAERHNRDVTFVYLVLPGINDSRADLERLVAMFSGQRARINLMRWNPVAGIRLGRTEDRVLALFRERLVRAGIPVVVRDTQGRDISAACGQLWLRDLNGRALAA
ncbi:23S rRNA (adenine(2503)-C(2))-methyltransferase RlmN [Paradevosia shaoguanensis]|uniref:23S rRNA (Adenine(2503)-C(2))-methyltransferase RlmN n=1 Tax=Paradevosia shaoguanensis TaxID=1335043 RepID=A0AA41UCI0_9HYPH|nr:23S rRNA (adenine(2503)-C(2))-methyltransferase RlmN [Paradevosia shaoguanensis]MCF1744170.1 23S rRNA (adenine(2503)-C(2))-methyltransferase RlmN [Paradevosia shaoguanensis]MCI0128653.1 23S rRNA (adenine(2503)-C(2))-methyltransferase RlmN [Paradevosia shaoguanensis]